MTKCSLEMAEMLKRERYKGFNQSPSENNLSKPSKENRNECICVSFYRWLSLPVSVCCLLGLSVFCPRIWDKLLLWLFTCFSQSEKWLLGENVIRWVVKSRSNINQQEGSSQDDKQTGYCARRNLLQKLRIIYNILWNNLLSQQKYYIFLSLDYICVYGSHVETRTSWRYILGIYLC